MGAVIFSARTLARMLTYWLLLKVWTPSATFPREHLPVDTFRIQRSDVSPLCHYSNHSDLFVVLPLVPRGISADFQNFCHKDINNRLSPQYPTRVCGLISWHWKVLSEDLNESGDRENLGRLLGQTEALFNPPFSFEDSGLGRSLKLLSWKRALLSSTSSYSLFKINTELEAPSALLVMLLLILLQRPQAVHGRLDPKNLLSPKRAKLESENHYRPGELLIGAIVSAVKVFLRPLSFNTTPSSQAHM